MSYSVGEVARLAGVTVRTMHHYDEISLLTPSERSANGYRRYDDDDLVRLQQILYYRELGFSLEEIATILDDPGADALDHLRRQHALLAGRAEHLHKMLVAVETAMEAMQMGIQLNPEEMFEVFGDEDPTQHDEEARERWGRTDAYKESQLRVSRYGKDDWLRIKAEAAEVEHRFAEALRNGVPADSPEARATAEEHRQQISRNFYECPVRMHRGLGEMYVADPRFTKHYDDIAPGLAQYVREAIVANADTIRG